MYVRRSLLVADPGQTRRYGIDLLLAAQTHSCSLTYRGFAWCGWDSASAQRVLALTKTLCSHVLFPQKEVGACIPLPLQKGQVYVLGYIFMYPNFLLKANTRIHINGLYLKV